MNIEETSKGPGMGRRNFEVQTEPPKEDVAEKPPEYDYGAQTDYFVDRPVVPNIYIIHSLRQNQFKKLRAKMLEQK